MKRNKLTVGRERLRNLTFAGMRKAAGGGDTKGGGDNADCDDCDELTLSATWTHNRSYQVTNTIC